VVEWEGRPSFPGMQVLPLPATPGDKDSKEMLVAHRIDDTVRAVAHAEERISAALRAGTSSQRGYHSTHIANHLAVALDNMHFLVDDLRRHYPAEAAELEAVRQSIGLARPLSKALRAATAAHLIETVLHQLTHAKRHADQMLKPDPMLVWKFNADHAQNHLKGAQEHIDKLSEHVVENYPGEGRWLRLLKKLQDGHLETDEAAWKALKLAAGRSRTQPQTLAAAHYGEGRGTAAAECGTCRYAGAFGPLRTGQCLMFKAEVKQGGLCDEFESKAPAGISLAVPGRNDQYGLHQVPSQTTSPSPPLPSAVPLPKPAECLALVKLVPSGIDISLSNTVRQALRMAALKLEKNDVIEALACLRQAQAALYSASKKDQGAGRPAVYGVGSVPGAEQSSALAQMMREYQDQAMAWRKIGTAVAQLIDRVRRHYFADRVNGYLPNLRMSREGD
jgi:hypothetical protein